MPQQIVFPCPSCGASLSVDPGAGTTQCQFCGSTAVVPAALRGAAQPSGSLYTPLPAELPGVGSIGLDPVRAKGIGDAVRAGNKAEAVRLYQEMLGADYPSAQRAIDMLAAGQSVQIGTLANGAPEYLGVDSVAPAAPYVTPVMPYAVPMVNPDYTGTSNRVWRSVIGLNLFITGAVIVLTLCITVAAMLPFVLFMVPGFFPWLAQVMSQLTSH